MRLGKTWALVTSLLIVSAFACSPKSAPVLSPPGRLLQPHSDQVCFVDPGEISSLLISEVLDTAGLRRELEEVRASDAGVGADATVRSPDSISYVLQYDRDGRPGSVTAWPSRSALGAGHDVTRIVGARVRPLGPLLHPESVRFVVHISSPPELHVVSPIECLPHLAHEPGQRPSGLPPDVSIESSGRWLPRRRSSASGMAVIRVRIDESGKLLGMEGLSGDGASRRAAREIIGQLTFGPALRNGEPIPGVLVQRFTFDKND